MNWEIQVRPQSGGWEYRLVPVKFGDDGPACSGSSADGWALTHRWAIRRAKRMLARHEERQTAWETV